VAADGGVSSDRDPLVDAHFLADGDVGGDVHMAGEHRQDAERDPVAESAVVGDVGPLVEAIVVADPGHAAVFLGAAVDRHPLGDGVVVADLDASRLTVVGDVLGSPSDRHEWTDRVVLTQLDDPHQADVAGQSSASADPHLRADHATGPDLRLLAQHRKRIDTC
jgi:hypothetical protein